MVWARGLEGEPARCSADGAGAGWRPLAGCDPTLADPTAIGGLWGLAVPDPAGVEGGRYGSSHVSGGYEDIPHFYARSWILGICGAAGVRYERRVEGGPQSRVLSAELRCGDRAWDLAAHGMVVTAFSVGERLYVATSEAQAFALVELGERPARVRLVPLPTAR